MTAEGREPPPRSLPGSALVLGMVRAGGADDGGAVLVLADAHRGVPPAGRRPRRRTARQQPAGGGRRGGGGRNPDVSLLQVMLKVPFDPGSPDADSPAAASRGGAGQNREGRRGVGVRGAVRGCWRCTSAATGRTGRSPARRSPAPCPPPGRVPNDRPSPRTRRSPSRTPGTRAACGSRARRAGPAAPGRRGRSGSTPRSRPRSAAAAGVSLAELRLKHTRLDRRAGQPAGAGGRGLHLSGPRYAQVPRLRRPPDAVPDVALLGLEPGDARRLGAHEGRVPRRRRRPAGAPANRPPPGRRAGPVSGPGRSAVTGSAG